MLLTTGIAQKICAQDDSVAIVNPEFSDVPDSVNLSGNPAVVNVKDSPHFRPDPKKAWIMAAVFPGLGQIYNQQYWKLPIVYGGLTACLYSITWNNKTYQDYRRAYFDIMADYAADPQAQNPDSWHQSWQDFIPVGSDPATRLNNTTFHSNLKRGKDYYRRYRDLSVIICIGIYLVFVADAYVDAQMFDFDISPDLSLNIVPEIMPPTFVNSQSLGLSLCVTF